MRLESIHRYPIKSCAGVQAAQVRLTRRGIEHDRRWMVTDPDGIFVSQRDHPRMALIRPRVTAHGLEVHAPEVEPLLVHGADEGARQPVTIWDDTCEAFDEGDTAARWFSRVLGVDCRLVRQASDADRPVARAFDPADGRIQVSFADGFPLLLASTGSLDDLNRRLGPAGAVPMDRFRPNLVVSGVPPWVEDDWIRIRIGPPSDPGESSADPRESSADPHEPSASPGEGIHFAVMKSCARCVVTTTDQATAERGKEPLATLARFRRSPRGVLFGQNLVHLAQGTLQAGWTVQVLDEGREVEVTGDVEGER